MCTCLFVFVSVFVSVSVYIYIYMHVKVYLSGKWMSIHAAPMYSPSSIFKAEFLVPAWVAEPDSCACQASQMPVRTPVCLQQPGDCYYWPQFLGAASEGTIVQHSSTWVGNQRCLQDHAVDLKQNWTWHMLKCCVLCCQSHAHANRIWKHGSQRDFRFPTLQCPPARTGMCRQGSSPGTVRPWHQA